MQTDALLWGWGGVRDEAPPLHRFDGPSFAHIWQRGVEPEGELQPCLPLPLPHIWLGGGANDDLLWACKSHAPPRPSLPIYGTGGETVRVGGATLPGPFMVKGRGQCE